MAVSRAAAAVEKVVGHDDTAVFTTDVSNYAKKDYGEETDTRIKATTWQGKNSVEVGQYLRAFYLEDKTTDIGITNS